MSNKNSMKINDDELPVPGLVGPTQNSNKKKPIIIISLSAIFIITAGYGLFGILSYEYEDGRPHPLRRKLGTSSTYTAATTTAPTTTTTTAPVVNVFTDDSDEVQFPRYGNDYIYLKTSGNGCDKGSQLGWYHCQSLVKWIHEEVECKCYANNPFDGSVYECDMNPLRHTPNGCAYDGICHWGPVVNPKCFKQAGFTDSDLKLHDEWFKKQYNEWSALLNIRKKNAFGWVHKHHPRAKNFPAGCSLDKVRILFNPAKESAGCTEDRPCICYTNQEHKYKDISAKFSVVDYLDTENNIPSVRPSQSECLALAQEHRVRFSFVSKKYEAKRPSGCYKMNDKWGFYFNREESAVSEVGCSNASKGRFCMYQNECKNTGEIVNAYTMHYWDHYNANNVIVRGNGGSSSMVIVDYWDRNNTMDHLNNTMDELDYSQGTNFTNVAECDPVDHLKFLDCPPVGKLKDMVKKSTGSKTRDCLGNSIKMIKQIKKEWERNPYAVMTKPVWWGHGPLTFEAIAELHHGKEFNPRTMNETLTSECNSLFASKSHCIIKSILTDECPKQLQQQDHQQKHQGLNRTTDEEEGGRMQMVIKRTNGCKVVRIVLEVSDDDGFFDNPGGVIQGTARLFLSLGDHVRLPYEPAQLRLLTPEYVSTSGRETFYELLRIYEQIS